MAFIMNMTGYGLQAKSLVIPETHTVITCHVLLGMFNVGMGFWAPYRPTSSNGTSITPSGAGDI
jgi:hypothetical protein